MQRKGTCQGTRRDGQPCQSEIVGERGYCAAHDPAMRDQVEAGRLKGGQNRATAARVDRLIPATLRPVVTKLLDALDGVENETLTPRQGAAMAAIASALVRVYEAGVVTERLEALEARAQQREGA